jgi:hypothetical protein
VDQAEQQGFSQNQQKSVKLSNLTCINSRARMQINTDYKDTIFIATNE